MNYQITINGQLFSVDVQAVGQAGGQPPVLQQPVPQQGVAAVPTPTVAAPAPAVAPAPMDRPEEQVTSPMPGNIWEVKVAVGQQVAAGETLVVLEAMKMENDIVAPRAGVVKQVLVTKGTAVEVNEVLVVLS